MANHTVILYGEEKDRPTKESNVELLKDQIKAISSSTISDEDVSRRVENLSQEELKYFTSNPNRIQIVGSNITTEEALIGAVFIAAVVLIFWVAAKDDMFTWAR